MKTAEEIYSKWYCEYRNGEHPTLTEGQIVIKAMEEYAEVRVGEYKNARKHSPHYHKTKELGNPYCEVCGLAMSNEIHIENFF